MITRVLAIAAFLLVCLAASSASAATAISYSEPDNTYGWCTGYSTSEAPGCAKQWCEQSNGQQCQLALVCDAGWNAIAYADSDEASGFGASCDLGSAYNARLTALASCIVQSRTVCWTEGTFDGSGNERSKDDNGDFDLTWYIQGLLHGLGYDPGSTDGAFGSRTRGAIRAFQADMGLDETGEVSEDLFYILLAKNGGVAFLVAGMEALSESFTSDERSRIFGASAAPLGNLTYSDELALRSTSVQRVLLADYLRFNDRDCPMPAARTEITDPSNGIWAVTCSGGGDFTITLSADGNSDTIADNNAAPSTDVAENGDDTSTPSTKDKSGTAPVVEIETMAASDAGIGFAHSMPEDSWAVCTGEAAAAADCAVQSCTRDYGGSACEAVLTCDDRTWSAAAMSPDHLRGMGFACGYTLPYGAREVALAECLAKTRAICRLVHTTDPDGSTMSAEDNDRFTLVYNAQILLSMLGYYQANLSGEVDDATTNAAVAFQTDVGVETTGTVDQDLVQLAYYAVLGEQAFVFVISRDIYDTLDPATASNHYGASDQPSTAPSFDEELMALGEDEQLRALAAAISLIDGFDCTIPAISAKSEGGGNWNVTCAEGPLSVMLDGFTINVTEAAETTPTPPPKPPKSTPERGPSRGEKTKG
jgi:peptidoglycan hydrolase-like protein with peptidoglycan-binding domain